MVSVNLARIKCRQNGAVLLFFVAFLVLGTSAVFLANQSINRSKIVRDDTIAKELQKAKQALISYAVNYADNYTSSTGPGHLPCPDTSVDSSGRPDTSCDPFEIGRLPIRWTREGKRFELYPFVDQSPRRFWYVPSESFRYNGTGARQVNSGTDGQLTVDGVIDDVIAVIIDPGPPLAGQIRPSSNPSDYLEGENMDGDSSFVSTSDDGPFNDRIVYITRSEFMPLVEQRVLGYVRDWFLDYFDINGHLPVPAPLGSGDNQCVDMNEEYGLIPESGCPAQPIFSQPDAWFRSNEWDQFLYYDSECFSNLDCNSEIVLNGSSNNLAVIISFGREIIPQDRNASPADLAQYLESEESTDGDSEYVVNRPGENNNDVAMIVNP